MFLSSYRGLANFMRMKYKDEFFIILSIFTSLLGVFLTSNEPLLSAFQGTAVESLFYASNEVFFNISSGFL